MSDNFNFLALKLEGPFQAWGFNSQFDVRNTGFWPTKSAIAGMICAALGYDRGSEKETQFLSQFLQVRLLTILIPRKGFHEKHEHKIRRMVDFHTIQGTLKASGGIKETHLTTRYYLNDASFGVLLSGVDKKLMIEIAEALKNPIWGIWLGRKNCIPTSPVFSGGPYGKREEALERLLGLSELKHFSYQSDALQLSEGVDSINDQAIHFNIEKRQYLPRRVNYHHKEK